MAELQKFTYGDLKRVLHEMDEAEHGCIDPSVLAQADGWEDAKLTENLPAEVSEQMRFFAAHFTKWQVPGRVGPLHLIGTNCLIR